MADAWITTRESYGDRPPSVATTPVVLDHPVTVGRAGQVCVGVGIPDSGISRVVATVAATAEGWTVQDTSRNGIIIHPWGLAPTRATASTRLHWPLIALRILGVEPDARHWLLLECDGYAADNVGLHRRAGTTARSDPPRPLTAAEHDALSTVFEGLLAWPPPLAPTEPLQLKQAARRLDISASAVKVRLEGARAKAELLGFESQSGGVTDAGYVHVLVAAGYVHRPEPYRDRTRRPSPDPDAGRYVTDPVD